MKKILLTLTLSASLFAQYNFLLGDELDILGNYRKKTTKYVHITQKKPQTQIYYTLLPYIGIIDYSKGTTKKDGYVKGIYFSIFNSPFKTEIDVEQTSISYKDNTSDLSQNDFTFLEHYYQGYNLDYKLGVHYIDSTDKLTDGGMIYILGILYYKTLLYNYGIDVYYSNYSNLDTSPKILQFTPKAGFNFGNYYSLFGSFYIEVAIDYIENLDIDKTYKSTSLKINNYNGNYTTSISFWNGDRVYAVENGGFVVNNIGEVQTKGFKFSESYKLSKKSLIKFEYSNTTFVETGDAESRVYVLSYSYSF